jgi:hypothetical protein
MHESTSHETTAAEPTSRSHEIQVTWLTQEAHDRLKQELDELIANRPIIAAKINDAREEGDLKENGDYWAAPRFPDSCLVGYFMLRAVGSGTRRRPRWGSCSRVPSGDVAHYNGIRCNAQRRSWRVGGWGTLCDGHVRS